MPLPLSHTCLSALTAPHYAAQGCADVFTVRPRVAGAPGALHLAVRDDTGPDSASSLAEDTLVLALEAGPVYCLAVAEPQPIECGLQAVLPLLRVLAMDAYGNASTVASCEVPPLRHPATMRREWGLAHRLRVQGLRLP